MLRIQKCGAFLKSGLPKSGSFLGKRKSNGILELWFFKLKRMG